MNVYTFKSAPIGYGPKVGTNDYLVSILYSINQSVFAMDIANDKAFKRRRL